MFIIFEIIIRSPLPLLSCENLILKENKLSCSLLFDYSLLSSLSCVGNFHRAEIEDDLRGILTAR